MDYEKPSVIDPIFNALEAYWPGLQILAGKSVKDATHTLGAFISVWQRFRFVPEKYDIHTGKPNPQDSRYILRPEMAESLFYAYNATQDGLWLLLGQDIYNSIQTYCKSECGYRPYDVYAVPTEDDKALPPEQWGLQIAGAMESFFLAETCKYLYLLYSLPLQDNFLLARSDFVFSTEAHPMWIPTPAPAHSHNDL